MGDKLVVQQEAADLPEMATLLLERATYLEDLHPGSGAARALVELRSGNLTLYGMRRNGRLVGCGSLIPHAGFTELKQVFLSAASRGAGLGKILLAALEAAAMDAGATMLRLEVGTRQHAAISLYRRASYVEIGPFGSYRAQPTSLFLQKRPSAASGRLSPRKSCMSGIPINRLFGAQARRGAARRSLRKSSRKSAA